MYSSTRFISESTTLSEVSSQLAVGHDGFLRCDVNGNFINNVNGNNSNTSCKDDGDIEKIFVFSGDSENNKHFSQWNRFPRSHKIGSGTFGNVFLCHDMLSTSPWYRHPVAVKVVSMETLSDSEVAFAMNEVAIVRHLQHKNIIQYIDSFIDNEKQLCLVSEYVDGGDLAVMIRRSSEKSNEHTTIKSSFQTHHLEERKKRTICNDAFNNKTTTTEPYTWIESYRITDIVRQCLEALSYIHSNFIIHRDVKPANVYITKSGVVKLGDFGVSKLVELSDPMASTFIGTPFYLSPELCLGEPYSFGADIWALGVIAYEMYCLKLPFLADNVLAQIHVVTEGQYDKEALYKSHVFNSFQLQTLEATYGSEFLYQEQTLHRLVVELVEQMLVLDSLERPSAAQLLREFFVTDPSRPMSSAESVVTSRQSQIVTERCLNKHVDVLCYQPAHFLSFSAENMNDSSAALFANRVNVSYEALVDMLPPERQEHVLRAASRPGSSAMPVENRRRLSLSMKENYVDLDSTIRSETRQVIAETIDRIPWLHDAKVFSSFSLQEGYKYDVLRVDWIDNNRFSLNSSQKGPSRSFLLSFGRNNEKNTVLSNQMSDEREVVRHVTAGAVSGAMEADCGTVMTLSSVSKETSKKVDLLPVAIHSDLTIETRQSDIYCRYYESNGKENQNQNEEEQQKQQQSVGLGRCQGLPIETLEGLLRAKIMASCIRRQQKLKEIREAHAVREKEKALMREELNKLYAKSFYERRNQTVIPKDMDAEGTVKLAATLAATQPPHFGVLAPLLPAAETGLSHDDKAPGGTFMFEQQSFNFFGSLTDSMTLRRKIDPNYITNEVTRIARDAADVADRCAMWTLKPPVRLDFAKMVSDDEPDRCSTSPSVADEKRGVNFDVYDTPVTLCIVWNESQVPVARKLSPSPSPVGEKSTGSLLLPLNLTLKPINRHTRLDGVVWRVKETLKASGLSHALFFPLDIDDSEEVGAEELGLRYIDRSGDVIAIAEASEWRYVKRDWWRRCDFTWLPLYMVYC